MRRLQLRNFMQIGVKRSGSWNMQRADRHSLPKQWDVTWKNRTSQN